MVGLQRLGVPSGPMRVIAVPGRKSGKLQVTPVSPLTVDGVEYVTGASAADWVKNARAAGWGDLTHGRRTARVTLHEVPVAERGAILREFPRLVPGGVAFYRRLYGLPQDPDA